MMTKLAVIAAAALTAAALPLSAAHAQDVSVRICTPEFGIRIGPPAYGPAYAPPVMVAPAPVVVAPPPVYYPPRYVIAPQPRVIVPAPVVYRPWFGPYGYWKHGWKHYRDRD